MCAHLQSAREEGSSLTRAFITWAPPNGTIGLATEQSSTVDRAEERLAAEALAKSAAPA
jgi:pyruvoyl-dependent arginine decarboxylase (PvlArgDC)